MAHVRAVVYLDEKDTLANGKGRARARGEGGGGACECLCILSPAFYTPKSFHVPLVCQVAGFRTCIIFQLDSRLTPSSTVPPTHPPAHSPVHPDINHQPCVTVVFVHVAV